MEDYKKKYENTLDNFKKIKAANKDNKELVAFIEYEYPELKESEDEKIRKALLNEFINLQSKGYKFAGLEGEEIIAWLEKQGEQKPADKVEPKFKVGDWITNGIDTNKIVDINLGEENYVFESGRGADIKLNNNICHLWTIQDAKEGDVLYTHSFTSDCVFLYKTTDEIELGRKVAVAYCCIDVYANRIEFGTQGPDCIDVRNVKPATKEQRDLLFQKMKEAGYEWDSEKKELKKIEQKPAWSEEDEYNFSWIIEDYKKAMQTAISSAWEGRFKTIVSWLKSLKERMKGE